MIAAVTLQALHGERARVDMAAAAQPPQPMPEILIVDADGRRVATATALRRVASEVYEVLVADAVMGRISGDEAAARSFCLPIEDGQR